MWLTSVVWGSRTGNMGTAALQQDLLDPEMGHQDVSHYVLQPLRFDRLLKDQPSQHMGGALVHDEEREGIIYRERGEPHVIVTEVATLL